MAVYLYTPPTWRKVQLMQGAWALRYGIPTSTCVYRQGGVWHNILEPGMDNPVVADVDTITQPNGTEFRLFFIKPMVVPDTLYAELSALEPADPSWTPGSLTLL